MTKESPLIEKDIIDVNHVIEVLERNINSMEKIEEKRNVIMTAEKKLSALQSTIKEQQDQFISRLEHLEKHSSKFITGAGVLGGAVGGYALGGAVGGYVNGSFESFEKFLPDGARTALLSVLCSPTFGVCLAAVGVGILVGIAAYAITEYIKDSSENCKEKLNKTYSNAENFLKKIKNLEAFLNHSGQIKTDIKEYTFNQIKDSLENETQRKQNHLVYDKFLEESQELIELINQP